MIRRVAFVVVTLLVVTSGASCASRNDLFVAWTINGFPAAEACQQLEAPTVSFRVVNQDGEVETEEKTSAPCADGKATLKAAPVATVFADLLEGQDVYGSDSTNVTTSGDGYVGHDEGTPVPLDITLTKGRLEAKLRVVGDKCGAAGASSFDVTLRRATSPLATEIVSEQTVACPGGEDDAVFAFKPVDIGSRYEVVATTTIDGVEYATDDGGAGEGVVIEGGLTDLTVDLDIVERP